jgi:hypothetical protein
MMLSYSTYLAPNTMRYLLYLAAALLITSCTTTKNNAVVVTKSTTLQQLSITGNKTSRLCALYYITTLKTDSLSGDTILHEKKARLNWFTSENEAAQQSCELSGDSIPMQLFGWIGEFIYFRNQLNEPFALNAKTGKIAKRGNAVFGITDTTQTLSAYRYVADAKSFLLTYSNGDRNLFNAQSGKLEKRFSPGIMKSWCERFGTNETTSAYILFEKRQFLRFEYLDTVNLKKVLVMRNFSGFDTGKPDTIAKTTFWLDAAFLNLTDSCSTPVRTSEKNVIVLHKKILKDKAEMLTCIDKKGKQLWSADLKGICGNTYQFAASNSKLFCAHENGFAIIGFKDGKVEKVNFKR